MYKRILSVQDLSCVGRCSLAVALPVLSACGAEACALPTAVLSTHSGGFSAPVCQDLSGDLERIADHWCREGVTFDGICTGYQASVEQIHRVVRVVDKLKTMHTRVIVDPAMADCGRYYRGLDGAFAEAMAELCARADLIVPNVTEACLLAGEPYCAAPDRGQVEELLSRLRARFGCDVLITGASDSPDRTGFSLYTGENVRFYSQPRLPGHFHGTGDLFAAALSGAWLAGMTPYDAGVVAADFTAAAIAATPKDRDARFGVCFETALPELARRVQKN